MKRYFRITQLYNYINEEELLLSLRRMPNYPDEPQIYRYGGQLNSIKSVSDGKEVGTSASGYSFASPSFALLKCFMEAIERNAMLCYREKSLLYLKYNDIRESALNPTLYIKDKNVWNEKMGWMYGFNVLSSKKTLIPAQAIFYNYVHKNAEPFLTTHISTGAAAGFDHESTLLRGIYEIIERDSFMCMYLANIKPYRINPDVLKNGKIKKILKKIRRYNLEVFLFDLTSDLGIPTFLTVLIDRTGLGQSISLGLKSSLNQETAIIGCLEEAVFIRGWMRSEMVLNGKNDFDINPENIESIKDRGLYWVSPKMIENFSNWLKEDFKHINIDACTYSSQDELSIVKRVLQHKKLSVFYVDITPAKFKKMGGYVYKAVIPQLQPIFFNEKSPEIRINRIQEVAKFFNIEKFTLNKTPHPFL